MAVLGSREATDTRLLYHGSGCSVSCAFTSGILRWSNRAGEERWRLDLAVGPQVYFPINRIPRWLNGYFFAALSGGGSVAWLSPGPHVAFTDDYDTGYGLNFGGSIGIVGRPKWFQQLAGYLEASYLFHAVNVTHRAQMADHSVVETYAFRSRGVFGSAGLEYWF